MTDIETPEAFVRRVAHGMPPCDFGSSQAMRAMSDAIRARDAAVRREALREAAHLLRDTAQIAAAVCGQSDTAGYRMAMANAEAIRALADKEPDDG